MTRHDTAHCEWHETTRHETTRDSTGSSLARHGALHCARIEEESGGKGGRRRREREQLVVGCARRLYGGRLQCDPAAAIVSLRACACVCVLYRNRYIYYCATPLSSSSSSSFNYTHPVLVPCPALPCPALPPPTNCQFLLKGRLSTFRFFLSFSTSFLPSFLSPLVVPSSSFRLFLFC